MPIRDLTNQRFGRLTVLGDSGERRGHCVVWDCVCDCGVRCKIVGYSLTKGDTVSCGCYHREAASKRLKQLNTTHQLSRERVYKIWKGIIGRCYNKNEKDYARYGGRGITVCDEWRNDVAAFKDWALASGYDDGLTIERINVNKGYSPDNCTWIPRGMQAYNRRNTTRYKGMALCIWSKKLRLNQDTVYNRVHRLGWSPEEALGFAPHVHGNKKSLDGRE